MKTFRFQGLLFGFIFSAWVVTIKADFTFVCSETSASLDYDDTCLDGLGVGVGDSLIINDEVEDSVANLASDDCFHTRANDDPPGILSWDLDECSPTVTQDEDNIYYCWYARNAEGSKVKRVNRCQKLECSIPRKYTVTSTMITLDDLSKDTLDPLEDIENMDLSIKTFNNAARGNGDLDMNFSPPEPVFVRVCIVGANVLPNFYVQIVRCTLSSSQLVAESAETCPIIVDGRAVDDEEAGIVLETAQPLMQDFSFNSFIWTNLDPPASKQFWITCTICLCNDAPDDVTCPDFPEPEPEIVTIPPALIGRRRRSITYKKTRSVTVGPIHVHPN